MMCLSTFIKTIYIIGRHGSSAVYQGRKNFISMSSTGYQSNMHKKTKTLELEEQTDPPPTLIDVNLKLIKYSFSYFHIYKENFVDFLNGKSYNALRSSVNNSIYDKYTIYFIETGMIDEASNIVSYMLLKGPTHKRSFRLFPGDETMPDYVMNYSDIINDLNLCTKDEIIWNEVELEHTCGNLVDASIVNKCCKLVLETFMNPPIKHVSPKISIPFLFSFHTDILTNISRFCTSGDFFSELDEDIRNRCQVKLKLIKPDDGYVSSNVIWQIKLFNIDELKPIESNSFGDKLTYGETFTLDVGDDSNGNVKSSAQSCFHQLRHHDITHNNSIKCSGWNVLSGCCLLLKRIFVLCPIPP